MTKRYLTARQVRARYGNLSDMGLWRWVENSGFPKPMYINGQRFFDEAKLDAWDAECEATGRPLANPREAAARKVA